MTEVDRIREKARPATRFMPPRFSVCRDSASGSHLLAGSYEVPEDPVAVPEACRPFGCDPRLI
jgi:hypothetical protein